jgi:Xaa-Pro aminopeptidase
VSAPTGYRQEFTAPPSPRLAEFMASGWAAPPAEPAPPAPPAGVTRARRAALAACRPGERIVIPAGQAPVRSNDQRYPFRPDSDYVWLTGDQTAGGVLVLDPSGDATLYLEPPSDRTEDGFWRDGARGELWNGPRQALDTVVDLLGIDVRPLAELGRLSLAITEPDKDLRRTLAELRLAKDDWEIEQLRHAVALTTDGFADVARALRAVSATTERDADAIFGASVRVAGNGCGYQTIAAAGPHAAVLHWTRNDGPLRQGDLLLLDAGAETRSLYTADITRTVPVSGRFTALQREVYQIVLAAQDAGLGALKPGAPFRDYHSACAEVLAAGLSDLGLLPVSPQESLREDCGLHRRWTLCAPGHMLGLDVHDCGQARAELYMDGTLEPGHVLTVEPGLYFQPDDLLVPEELRGLGVRIEDDVLITAYGCDLLSSGRLGRLRTSRHGWTGYDARGQGPACQLSQRGRRGAGGAWRVV